MRIVRQGRRGDRRRRYEVKRGTATAADVVTAMAELEKKLEAERVARFKTDYASPGARIA